MVTKRIAFARLRIDEAHYPDTVAHIFVVNAPWIFQALSLGSVHCWSFKSWAKSATARERDGVSEREEEERLCTALMAFGPGGLKHGKRGTGSDGVGGGDCASQQTRGGRCARRSIAR